VCTAPPPLLLLIAPPIDLAPALLLDPLPPFRAWDFPPLLVVAFIFFMLVIGVSWLLGRRGEPGAQEPQRDDLIPFGSIVDIWCNDKARYYIGTVVAQLEPRYSYGVKWGNHRKADVELHPEHESDDAKTIDGITPPDDEFSITADHFEQ
jgi:hypothetical protein